MAEQGPGAPSAGDALEIAVGTAVAAAVVDDSSTRPVDLATLPPNCLNCGAVVRGRFCVDCGQTTDTHVPTLVEVAGDAIASISNFDSRLWRTVTMLFFKPGFLTQEFLAGRRARYVPPLRLYLVLSVLTFLVLSFDTGSDASEFDQPAPEQRLATVNSPNEGIGAGSDNEDSDGIDCEEMDLPLLTRGGKVDSAIRQACNEGKADDFDSISDTFVDNIPLLAFMVIPVTAVVLKLLYLFAKRNYLAHLVFLCHTHAFTFLTFVVFSALLVVGRVVPALETPLLVLGVLMTFFYMPAYYFLAMRRVYGQGVMLTLLKQLVLMFIYLFVVGIVFTAGFVIVMLAT